VQLYYIRVKSG